MRLLASSCTPAELNRKGFGLYAEFRPVVEGWGGRAEMRCDAILELRQAGSLSSSPRANAKANSDGANMSNAQASGRESARAESEEQPSKKVKTMTVEEYEAILDETIDYDELAFTGEVTEQKEGSK